MRMGRRGVCLCVCVGGVGVFAYFALLIRSNTHTHTHTNSPISFPAPSRLPLLTGCWVIGKGVVPDQLNVLEKIFKQKVFSCAHTTQGRKEEREKGSLWEWMETHTHTCTRAHTHMYTHAYTCSPTHACNDMP